MDNSFAPEELYDKAEQARERSEYAAAFSSYQEAAKNGFALAMMRIGQMYYNGEGVSKDGGEAKRWIAKAVDAGDPVTMSDIGLMYVEGNGLPKDTGEAFQWFRKGAERGEALAMLELGIMYENGEAVNQDFDEAIHWYRRAAEKDKFSVRRLARTRLSHLGVGGS